MKTLLLTILLLSNIQHCEQIKTEIVPAVCGRCEIEVVDEKLYITPSQFCPRYTIYKCITQDQKVFYINNFKCQTD